MTAQNPNPTQRPDNGRLIRRLVTVVVGMFFFGFAMVPLYGVFCDLTGLNGKTAGTASAYSGGGIDNSRLITVEFASNLNEGMPLEFHSEITRVQVHPGAMNTVNFYARNQTDQDMVGQAIPSVAPGQGAQYFHKAECFCFSNQRFEPGEAREMPLRFVVDPELPAEIETLTLSYTFFDITEEALAEAPAAAQANSAL